ncbi:MAG TPA: hypothetical protein VLZ06_12230 [Solirubrobacteraceae bacterium]|nr:hypothetical protein [Solirubrobacteraceae bacterium]
MLIDSFLPAPRSELGEAASALHAATGAHVTFEEAAALALEDSP